MLAQSVKSLNIRSRCVAPQQKAAGRPFTAHQPRRSFRSISAPRAGPSTEAQKQQIAEYPDPTFCKAVLAKFQSTEGTCSAEEARVLYASDFAFLDVRSSIELESEGKILPKMRNVFHVPLVNFTKRYDSEKSRKVVDKKENAQFVAEVEKCLQNKEQGIILVCSGVPSEGQQRSKQAMKKLSDAGFKRLVALNGGYAEWALKFTNKLERRVVGFVIASGGTSIEQKGGVSSKGSGVSGKNAEDLLRDQLGNYTAGGVYADE